MRWNGLRFAACLGLSACLSPPPAQRVSDVAREVNLAARFGQLDTALGHTAEGARRTFAAHRASWGGPVRVLDLELSSLSMQDNENAILLIDFQWSRPEEDTLHVTRVEQTWRGGIEDKGWMIVRERRVSGDLGLFGERVARAEPVEPPKDVQFVSKTIR